MFSKFSLLAVAVAGLSATGAQAQVSIGNYGTASPNGVVTAPPAYGPSYQYVSTAGGITGAGQIAGVGGVNGSEYTTAAFTAASGDVLNFYFNYVTSDGSGFSDYGFAQLLQNGVSAGYLFSARTTPTGNTSPGFGLPANIATLTPATTPIIPGGPVWAQLGGDSGRCYNGAGNGCGYTGWINSAFTFSDTGLYQIRFGVTNVQDNSFQSGLAFAGVTLNNVPVGGTVPEPATWAMMILGFGVVGGAMRTGMRRSNRKFDASIRKIEASAA